MKIEQYEMLKEKGAHEALWLELLNASGFAGCARDGQIVDRRYYPESVPVAKNKLFGVSAPKSFNEKNFKRSMNDLILRNKAQEEAINTQIDTLDEYRNLIKDQSEKIEALQLALNRNKQWQQITTEKNTENFDE